MAHYAMVIDLTLCMRCRACMVACKTEHSIPTGKHAGNEYFRIRVLEYESGRYPEVNRVFAPILCMQCTTAPCIDVCPMKLMPTIISQYAQQDDFDKANECFALDCYECGCCSYVCPSKIPLVHWIKHAKAELMKRKKK